MENTSVHIAQTILNQIKNLDKSALMAWGANSYCSLSQTKHRVGGLSFKVNGLTHQGWVTIELNWLDTYNVIFTNENRDVVKTFEDIYCDMLVNIIDYIEGKHVA